MKIRTVSIKATGLDSSKSHFTREKKWWGGCDSILNKMKET